MAIDSKASLRVEDSDVVERYGVTRVLTEIFKLREFSYTNIEDAIAQAEHQTQAENRHPVTPKTADDLARLGISSVIVDRFKCGAYIYTNRDDAIAEANRQR